MTIVELYETEKNYTSNLLTILEVCSTLKLITLQDIFVASHYLSIAVPLLQVRKYGEIEQKPSYFGCHRK